MSRHGKVLDEQGRNPSRDREDDGVVFAEIDLVFTEFEGPHMVVREFERAELMIEADFNSVPLKVGDRRINECCPEPIFSDERSASPAAPRQGLAHDGTSERGRCDGWIRIERSKKYRT